MQEIILVHLTGDDRPGLTAGLSVTLKAHGVEILDLNQTVIHRTLLLGLMLRIPPAGASTDLLKDLLFEAHRMGLRMRMTPIDGGEYDAWVERQGKPRYIMTLLTRRLTAAHVAGVSKVIS